MSKSASCDIAAAIKFSADSAAPDHLNLLNAERCPGLQSFIVKKSVISAKVGRLSGLNGENEGKG